jgi:hypothetical protein
LEDAMPPGSAEEQHEYGGTVLEFTELNLGDDLHLIGRGYESHAKIVAIGEVPWVVVSVASGQVPVGESKLPDSGTAVAMLAGTMEREEPGKPLDQFWLPGVLAPTSTSKLVVVYTDTGGEFTQHLVDRVTLYRLNTTPVRYSANPPADIS